MALDEHLLRRAATHGPALRVYAWAPPAVSLGYGQPAADVDRDALAAAGVALTRRLTGGRAVLHQHELTYSVAVEAARLNVGRSVTRAYQILAGGLIEALARLGLPAVCTPRAAEPAAARDPACFAATIGGDLSVAGRKLVGSAQCHRFDGILQHGSLPLRVDEALLDRCLRRPPGAGRTWTTLDELGVQVSPEAFAAALAEGFAALFGERPALGEPTAEDWAAAGDLTAQYAGDDWILRI